MSIETTNEGHVALYDGVSGNTLGVVFEGEEQARHFLQWAGATRPEDDVRSWSINTFRSRHGEWWDAFVDGESGELKDDAWDRLEELVSE